MSKRGDSDGGNTGEARSGAGRRDNRAVQWFNPSPNDSDRAWLDNHGDKLIELGLSLLEAIPEDGRFTIKFDVASGRWLAILFLRSNNEAFSMDAMSVRGASAFDALCLLSYFHHIKFEEAWVEHTGEVAGRWG